MAEGVAPSVRSVRLSACAADIFSTCSFVRLGRHYESPLTPHIGHAYLIHHSTNRRRGMFQRWQLPLLGLNTSIVSGWDAENINSATRGCLLAAGAPQKLGTPYLSQVVKLFSALYDMLRGGVPRALFLEDDVLVRYEHLGALSVVLRVLGRPRTNVRSARPCRPTRCPCDPSPPLASRPPLPSLAPCS